MATATTRRRRSSRRRAPAAPPPPPAPLVIVPQARRRLIRSARNLYWALQNYGKNIPYPFGTTGQLNAGAAAFTPRVFPSIPLPLTGLDQINRLLAAVNNFAGRRLPNTSAITLTHRRLTDLSRLLNDAARGVRYTLDTVVAAHRGTTHQLSPSTATTSLPGFSRGGFSLASVVSNLESIQHSYADVQIGLHSFSFVTPTVILEARNLGRFRLKFSYERLSTAVQSIYFAVEPLEPYNCGGYYHPNISSSSGICQGDGARLLPAAIATGRVLDACDIITAVISTYGGNSPYEHLREWSPYGQPNPLPADARWPIFPTPPGVRYFSADACRCSRCSVPRFLNELTCETLCRSCHAIMHPTIPFLTGYPPSGVGPPVPLPPPEVPAPPPAVEEEVAPAETPASDTEEEDPGEANTCAMCRTVVFEGDDADGGEDETGRYLCANCGHWCESCQCYHTN